MEEQILVKCDCGTEILKAEYWQDEKTVCLVHFRYMPLRYSIKRRLKFLFSGIVEFNEILLSPEETKKLSDWLNNVKQ